MICTSVETLTEFVTFFSAAPWQRSRAVATVRSLLADPKVRVIPQSRESSLAGMSLYNDRHFEQEGFRALFRGL